MSIAVGQKVIAAGAILAAVWLGWMIAEGANLVPALLACLALLGCLTQLIRVSLGAMMLGVVLFGYLVGNRGFAQLMPIPAIPILPAELVLGVAGAWVIVQCAFAQRLPFRRDALNVLVLLWLIVGTARVSFDVRQFGFMAVRDYAMVYYALFFFLAQQLAAERGARRFLIAMLVAASVAQPITTLLSTRFPDFFLSTLAIRGYPVIYFKDDLTGNFMAMGSLLFFMRFEETRRFAWLALSLALAGWMLTTNSRSSMVGLAVGALWLGLSGRWRFAGTLTICALIAAVGMVFIAEVQGESWRQTPLHRAKHLLPLLYNLPKQVM